MAAPEKYPDELRERAVRLYRESDRLSCVAARPLYGRNPATPFAANVATATSVTDSDQCQSRVAP